MLAAFLLALAVCPALAQTACAPERCTGATPRCPVSTGIVSKTVAGAAVEKVYFRNAAPFPADILKVDEQGQEISQGLLPSGMRRALPSVHGDVWLARAVRPGTAADRRLLLEHRVGAVPIDDCDCPNPQFVDCSKPPVRRTDAVVSDPIVFENRAAEPVDVFFWNGTCEELVSWDEIGGVQPLNRKPLLSTQGHAFRLRSASSRRLLMAHTLNDLVVRSCDEDEATLRGSTLDGLDALRVETSFFEREAATLRGRLADELARLTLALSRGSNATDAEFAAVAPAGATWSMPAAAVASAFGLAK